MLKYFGLCCCVLFLSACGGPVFWFSGGKLTGPEAVFSSAAVPAQTTVIQLETRPSQPYSVNVNGIVHDGSLFVDPAPERNWYKHMAENPSIRVKIDGRVYAARAVAVEDPDILSAFEAGRKVMHIQAP